MTAVVLQGVGRNRAASKEAFAHILHEREKTSAFLIHVLVVWEWQAPLEISVAPLS